MRRIRAISRKEWIHVIRDPRSLAAALLLPVVLVLLYGYATSFDLNELRWMMVDNDHSATSRRIVEILDATPPFHFGGHLARADDTDAAFQRGDARVVLVVSPGFERALQTGRPSPLQVLIDGSEGTVASVAQAYCEGAIAAISDELNQSLARAKGLNPKTLQPPLDVRTRVLYNPDLESRKFLVPGLIGVVLMMLSALLTSAVVVRERERGTFELLAASPVSPPELLIGKLLPYLSLSVIDVCVAVALGWGVFGVEPQGSLLLLFALSFIYVLAASMMGLFFSCTARNQQTAMMLAFVATVLPTMMLSGFAFPVRNMPFLLRCIAQTQPATHYIAIARGVILKGIGIEPIAIHVVALLLITAWWMRMALRRFSKTL